MPNSRSGRPARSHSIPPSPALAVAAGEAFAAAFGGDELGRDVFYQAETVWLTQKALAELFGVQVPAVNKHLTNIFASGELTREATVSKMEIVRGEGGREVQREVEFYNLDAIIAVGYRVNSYLATQFRIWATKTLREFFTKAEQEYETYRQRQDIEGEGK